MSTALRRRRLCVRIAPSRQPGRLHVRNCAEKEVEPGGAWTRLLTEGRLPPWASSAPTSALEGSPAARQLVLKTRARRKAWGLDTSTLCLRSGRLLAFRPMWDSTLGERTRPLTETEAGSNPAPTAPRPGGRAVRRRSATPSRPVRLGSGSPRRSGAVGSARPCQGRGRRFEPGLRLHPVEVLRQHAWPPTKWREFNSHRRVQAALAQPVEPWLCNPEAGVRVVHAAPRVEGVSGSHTSVKHSRIWFDSSRPTTLR